MKTTLSAGCLVLAALGGCVGGDAHRRQIYDARYQRALSLCGRPDAAFQAGYNAGYRGEPMQGEWSELCVAEARSQAVTAYQTGFLQGANNAPIRVIAPRLDRAPARSVPRTAECTFDSDCGGEGWHCRNRECMGFGAIGERCVFNDDCANDHCLGGTCRE